ncbi:asparagine synthase [Betaproteobacteria bacterium PRO4]|uniref:asparagine synthetase B family protein n=1 Tax=Nitrosomonas sp. TaxID=42353 RepID=UPI00256E7924|nr:asparagine synthase C-terminal domain-containing protein [Nitrosomonas sp.]MDL1865913.1 asparagine synthase [Betaproteobacteria bacterium PRO4]
MSGICGWLGSNHSAIENQQTIEHMIRQLSRFDGHPAHTAIRGNAALSVTAKTSHAHLYENDGLLVGIWGRIKSRDTHFQAAIDAKGMAMALADQWRQKNKLSFADLAGEFVCCIVDSHTGETALAVDPLGTHVLYYQLLRDGLLFSTSADALLTHPQASSEINPQGLFNYFYFHMIPGPDTIYSAQKRLLPGEYLLYRSGHAETSHYQKIEFHEDIKRPFPELQQEFLSLLRKSVSEAIQDQKAGAFLSGGTDSSTLAGILTEITGEPAKTYSIGFEATGYDEMHYARIAARHFSTDHHEYYVTPDDVVETIPLIASVFDQPFGNASALPAYYCARMARNDGLDLLLGGDGGDELFGGNVRYAKQYIFSLYDKIPAPLRNYLLSPLFLSLPPDTGPKLLRKARSYISQASIPMPHRMETYNLLMHYGFDTVFSPELLDKMDATQPGRMIEQTYQAASGARSLINRMLAFDWKFTLADNDFPKVVQSCHLAGMEVAFPFANDEMLAFSLALAPDQKLKGTQLRYFFKQALRGFLPDEIITKQKQGFGLPFGVWLQTHKPLRDIASDSLNDLKSRHIIRNDFIDKLLDQHLHEHASYHGTMVWLLMMLEYWFKQHNLSKK